MSIASESSAVFSVPSKVELSIQKSRLYRASFDKVDCFEKLIIVTQKKLEALEKNESVLDVGDAMTLGLHKDAVANYKRMLVDYERLRDEALKIISDIDEEER